MNITVLATGSRGDVQPFIALAYGLAQAGHEVRLVSNVQYAAWAARYGLSFGPVDWDAQQTLRDSPPPSHIEWRDLPGQIRRANQNTRQIFARAQADSWAHCQDAECLVYSLISPWGQSIAERLGIPALPGFLHPLTPTRQFPAQLILRNLGGALNYLSHLLGEQALWLTVRGAINDFRRQNLGLPAYPFNETLLGRLRRERTPILYSLSPSLIPRPPDWPEHVHMAGAWFLPSPPDWLPPPDLAEFLQAGSPAVYIGFGSMVLPGAESLAVLVQLALRQAGLRGVLARGWGGLRPGSPEPDIYVLDEIPHDWLFPRLAGVVHHGGAGTTQAGARAGVPGLVIPHTQDQPFWGKCLFDLGVGVAPLPEKQLTVERLAESLKTLSTDPDLHRRAALLGEQMRAERGLESTIEVIESFFIRGKLQIDE